VWPRTRRACAQHHGALGEPDAQWRPVVAGYPTGAGITHSAQQPELSSGCWAGSSVLTELPAH